MTKFFTRTILILSFIFVTLSQANSQVVIDLTDKNNVEPNQEIIITMSISGLASSLNPLGIQGSLNFDSNLLQYVSFSPVQSMPGLQVSEVAGHPDKITFLWSIDYGNSSLTNGDIVDFTFVFKGTYDQQVDLYWNDEPVALLVVDDVFQPIASIWNGAEIISKSCNIVEIIENTYDKYFCIDEQDNIGLNIEVTGTEPINYQWQFYDGNKWEDIADNLPSGTTYTGVNDSELIISGYTDEGTYKYRCLISNCYPNHIAVSNITSITINPLPLIVCPVYDDICVDSNEFQLFGASPVGGNYSGLGVSNNIFNPLNASIGSNEIIYSYTNLETGCTNTCSFDIVVNDLPTVICPPDIIITENNLVELSGVSPQGGIFSGIGVEGGYFNPDGLFDGKYTITYSYIDSNTECLNYCNFEITVNIGNYVVIDLSSHYEVDNSEVITVVMSVSNLPEDVNPIAIQGTVKFDTDLLEYIGYIQYQLIGSSLSISDVSGKPDLKTILWSVEQGSSNVSNGDLLGLQFLFKGEGANCAEIQWVGDPLLELIIDNEWNELVSVWNNSEVCGKEILETYSISGKSKYAGPVSVGNHSPIYNNPKYYLDSVVVILENTNGVEVGRDTTCYQGSFLIDNIVEQGDYFLKYKKINNDYIKWLNSSTGVNVADLGLFRMHLQDPYDERFKFDEFYLNAMDFNNDGKLNSIDLSMLQSKIVNPFNPDFINNVNFLPNGTWKGGEKEITINSTLSGYEIILIAYGDYNGSATSYMYKDETIVFWNQIKCNNNYDFIYQSESMITVEGNLFTLPVYVSENFYDITGLQFELSYPSDKFRLESAEINIEKTAISSKINQDYSENSKLVKDFLVTDIDGIIRILYSAPANVSHNLSRKEALLNLKFEKLEPTQNIKDFVLNGFTSLILTSDFDLISPANLVIPKLAEGITIIEESDLLKLSVYPNPAKDIVYIEFNSKASGFADISILDVIGREVIRVENTGLLSGSNVLELDISILSKGLYTIYLNYSNINYNKLFNVKLIVE